MSRVCTLFAHVAENELNVLQSTSIYIATWYCCYYYYFFICTYEYLLFCCLSFHAVHKVLSECDWTWHYYVFS